MSNNAAAFMQPTLGGSLISLRPLAAGDFDALFAVAADPLLWEQHPEPTRYQRDVFERFFHAGMASEGALVAVHNQSKKLVACSRYYDWRPEDSTVCIGYTFVAREYWGGGLNRELKTLMIKHALDQVSTVLFEVGAENHRSCRALEKIGATFSHKTAPEAGKRPGLVYSISAAVAA